MKLMIYGLIFIIMFFWVAGTKIQFSPFRISFTSLWWAIGWCLAIVGVVTMSVSTYVDGYKAGYKKAKEIEIEQTSETKYL